MSHKKNDASIVDRTIQIHANVAIQASLALDAGHDLGKDRSNALTAIADCAAKVEIEKIMTAQPVKSAASNRRATRLSRPNDARAVRSRAALREALLTLIETHPFEEISIRDITNQAGVSYPVFYRRYDAKEQVLTDIAEDEVRKLFEITYPALTGEGPKSGLEQLCAYVTAHRALWRILLTRGAAGRMREEFVKASVDIANSSKRANPWLPVSLASNFVASGIFEILAWWLQQAEDYPTRNVITFLEQLIVQPTLEPREVKLD